MDHKLFIVILLIIFSSCKKKTYNSSKVNNEYKLVNTFNHDINSFTEGLFYDGTDFYESTGSPESIPHTKSVFGILNLNTGKIDVKGELNKQIYFGEGIAKADDKIFQLTYLNKTGFVYDAITFKKIESFSFENSEGWGLTNIGNDTLIMSDGTDILTYINVKNLKPVKKIRVKEFGIPLNNINELEYVNGYIYANIYTENRIVKINIKNGEVIKSIDLSRLYYDSKNIHPNSLEMNGIAYNKKANTFFITGKMWPRIYEIKLNDN